MATVVGSVVGRGLDSSTYDRELAEPSHVRGKPSLSAQQKKIREIVARYRKPSTARALWQVTNTVIPFAALLVAAWISVSYSYWLTLGLSVVLAAFMTRIFVLHHDCSHGSFLPSRRMNEFFGFWLGLLTLTPFARWRRSHNIHHAHSGEMELRGEGYIDLYTVREFYDLPWWKQWLYRIYRHPLLMVGLGPWIQFVFIERFTKDIPPHAHAAKRSVYRTNLALGAILAATYFIGGWSAVGTLCIVYGLTAFFAGAIGVGLFYVQHHFEHAYFRPRKEWSFDEAAWEGSSFLDLPQWMHWFSANIGFHHIHHLDSQVPNYRLQECYYENPEMKAPITLTLWDIPKCFGLDLWDEASQRLVTFKEARLLMQS